MSNGGSEPSDKHDVSSMEGIPVKISENYKPPKKITPLGPLRVNADSIQEQYDFTLENNIVSKIGLWRQIRRSNVENRQKRIAEHRDRMAKLMAVSQISTIEASTSQGATVPFSVVSYDPSSSSVDESAINSQILLPEPISSRKESFKVNSIAREINISDFESDTSSPFDNMELKTLNDLEELAQCLQTEGSISESSLKPDFCIRESQNCLDYENTRDTPVSCDIQAFKQMNAMPTLHSSVSQPTYIVNQLNCYNLPSLNQIEHLPPNNPTSYSNSCFPHQDPSNVIQSVPDIVQQLKGVLNIKKAAVSRKQDILSTSIPTTLKNVNKPSAISSLPNPYTSLSDSVKKLCDHIVEMGFQQSRAARACQLFGDDETKVIEFLVQLQVLEDKGYPCDRAEKVFIANDYNEAETVKFLDNMKQLLNLGFREEQVSEALNKFNNNQDKALDFLVS